MSLIIGAQVVMTVAFWVKCAISTALIFGFQKVTGFFSIATLLAIPFILLMFLIFPGLGGGAP